MRVRVLAGSLVLLLTATWLLSGVLVAATSPAAVAAGRASVSFLGLSLVAASSPAIRGPAAEVLVRRPAAVTLLGALGVFGYSLASVVAISLIGASTTNVVLAMLPCVTFLLGVIGFSERPTRRAWAGTCVAGVAAVAYGWLNQGHGLGVRHGTSPAGTVIGVATAITAVGCMACYAHYYSRLASGASSLVTLPAVFGAGAAMLLVPALSIGAFSRVTAGQWLGLVILGGPVYVPVYIVQHELLLAKGAVFTTSVSLVVPIVVRICEWGMGADGPPTPVDIGLLIVCCAGVRTVLTEPENPSGP